MATLGMFFTRGVSLKKWLDTGLFDRELLIYRELLCSGMFSRVYWFTYGRFDRELARSLTRSGRLPGEIEVVCCPAWLKWFGRGASAVYSLLMPLLAFKNLKRCDAFKTNQMDGAITAVIASFFFRRPLYVRTGYTLSRVVDRLFARNWIRRAAAWLTEYVAFRFCNMSSVSSRFDLDYVVRRYRLKGKEPMVIGNFVDTDAFSPREDTAKTDRIIYVGRLSPEKNLAMAIHACQATGTGLDIVGEGLERERLEAVVRNVGADVRWLGIVANQQLPAVLNRYTYFLLPSLWEGMPKALLEAMASGLVCIGNNTTGINEVIEDGVTGYLASGPSSVDLGEAILRARAGDRTSISVAAREFVVRSFSLGAIAAKEAEIFSKLLSAHADCASSHSE